MSDTLTVSDEAGGDSMAQVQFNCRYDQNELLVSISEVVDSPPVSLCEYKEMKDHSETAQLA